MVREIPFPVREDSLMTAGRVPGPLGAGHDGIANDFLTNRVHRIGSGATRQGAVPGPLGQHFYADKAGGSGGPPAPLVGKKRALIVIGAGQEQLKKGMGRAGTNENLDAAARSAFAPFTKDLDVTLRHVKNAKEMKDLIGIHTWDVVVYFGHGYVNARALSPAHDGNDALEQADFAAALKAAGVKKVYLFGCSAADTGLARTLSTDLPGTNVYGILDTLEARWEMGRDASGAYNRLKFSEQPTEYTNGKRTVDGKKTPKRPRDRLDPIKAGDDSTEVDQ
jgi:hypothetical protein